MIWDYIQNTSLEPVRIVRYKVLVTDKPTLKWLGLDNPEMIHINLDRGPDIMDIKFPMRHIHITEVLSYSVGDNGINVRFIFKNKVLQFFRDRLVAEP